MSLILEALRKSEAERRRGEAPGLRVELPPVAASRRGAVPAWAWIAGGALLLFALLVALWPHGSGSGADDRADATPTGQGLAVTAVVRPAAEPEEPVGTGPGDAFPRVDRIMPPEPSPAEAVAAAEPAPTGSSLSTRSADPVAADPAPAIPPAGMRPDAGIPRIAELASAQRQRLPAMKLSMHMWNEDPARRFVVIDGRRRIEGDRVGDARIATIDREGVLLDLDGHQVRVPLP